MKTLLLTGLIKLGMPVLCKTNGAVGNGYVKVCGYPFILFVLGALFAPSLRSETAGPDEAFAALRAIQKPETTIPSFKGVFVPNRRETIVLVGGTNVVDQQFANYFETMATVAWPNIHFRFRNLAWEADTVYRQQRPLYFFDRNLSDQRAGSTPDQRQRVEGGTVIVRFGKMESLDGIPSIDRFRDAYGAFLDKLLEITPRVIVVTPTPFFISGPAAKIARKRNEVLDVYAHSIRVVADERSLLLIDLFREIPARRELSTNGVHLNDEGQRQVAKAMIRALDGVIPEEMIYTAEFRQLREQIAYKNSVWLQYFRPTNWSFLYGDRQHVPSSRDHIDREKRWFPFEIESALSLIENEENAIFELAEMMGGKK